MIFCDIANYAIAIKQHITPRRQHNRDWFTIAWAQCATMNSCNLIRFGQFDNVISATPSSSSSNLNFNLIYLFSRANHFFCCCCPFGLSSLVAHGDSDLRHRFSCDPFSFVCHLASKDLFCDFYYCFWARKEKKKRLSAQRSTLIQTRNV